MNVGSIGYACHSGLGHLMRDFYGHGVVSKVLVIKHPHYQHYNNWYPSEDTFDRNRREEFLRSIDLLLLFEVAVVNTWDIVSRAKQRGIKIVIIPNYEWTPFPITVRPDLVLCGSLLDVDYYRDHYRTEFLTIPVDTNRFPWRLRNCAETFVHNAGHGQWKWAKGTPQIIEAMNRIESPARLIVRAQPGEKRTSQMLQEQKDNPRIDFRFGEFNEDQLYSEGDVFINAEQLNGMSLMLQEAFASGMPVMTTDRYPTNTWLPKDMLIPVERYEKTRIAVEFDRAVVSPESIARKIDEWYGRDTTELSLAGRAWAEDNSWSKLKPKYVKILEDVIGG